MPIYEYVCPNCGRKEERTILSLQEEEAACPKCRLPMLKVPSLPRIKSETRGMFGKKVKQ